MWRWLLLPVLLVYENTVGYGTIDTLDKIIDWMED